MRRFVLGAVGLAGCIGTIGDPGAGVEGTGDDPGTVTVHRLNRTEYRNTVRDLLASALDPAATFPADDVSFGFDNISSVLTTPPLLVELWERAATDLAEEALRVPSSSQSLHYEAETLTGDNGSVSGSAWVLVSNGTVGAAVPLSSAGEYRIQARVWGGQAGPDLVQASLVGGGATLDTFTIAGDQSAPEIISWQGSLTAGSMLVGVAFLNDYYMPPDDRNLFVDWISVEGPLGVVGNNPIRDKLVFCDLLDPGCRRDVVTELGRRAWRRPLADAEVDRLMTLVDLALGQGDSPDQGIELAMRAILLSAHFVYRPELDDDPTSTTPHPLGDYELASRISYFLWSSMPDDALLEAAANGELGSDEGLRAQVRRMLADPKADALVENFAGQWLLIRALEDHVPDYDTFPAYDEALEQALRSEVQLFFREFLLGNRPLDRLLDAGFTFLNDRLAAHYGLPFTGGAEMQQVEVSPSDQRFGMLTLGGWLTATSYPKRTSPVKRGVWVLERLLCDRPADPPSGVPQLQEEEAGGTLRARLEAHRQNPVCASCHRLMDPLGLGLENYDAVGAYRTADNGEPVDASGVFIGGDASETPFAGAREMAGLIQSDPRFMSCIAQKLMVYALGRGIESSERPTLDAILSQLGAGEIKMPALIEEIVLSQPFRTRRGTKEAQP